MRDVIDLPIPGDIGLMPRANTSGVLLKERELQTSEQLGLVIGTRFWGSGAQDLARLLPFCNAATDLGKVFIAIDPERDKMDTLHWLADYHDHVHANIVAFPVTPWGKFAPALNAIIYQAALAKAKYLLLASVEFPPRADQVEILMRYMNEDTVVVGARFPEHEFRPGVRFAGSGTTVPWNTFALYNLRYLAPIGFVMAGDAPFDPDKAGVEEVTTLGVIQRAFGSLSLEIKLVEVIGMGDWNMEGWSDARREAHTRKIQSKKEQAAAQILAYGLPLPRVTHIK